MAKVRTAPALTKLAVRTARTSRSGFGRGGGGRLPRRLPGRPSFHRTVRAMSGAALRRRLSFASRQPEAHSKDFRVARPDEVLGQPTSVLVGAVLQLDPGQGDLALMMSDHGAHEVDVGVAGPANVSGLVKTFIGLLERAGRGRVSQGVGMAGVLVDRLDGRSRRTIGRGLTRHHAEQKGCSRQEGCDEGEPAKAFHGLYPG